jgi:hypothetical protein
METPHCTIVATTRPIGFGLRMAAEDGSARVFVVGEHDPMTDKAVVLHRDPLTDKGMTGNFHPAADADPFWGLDEDANLALVADFAAIQIDECVQLDVAADVDIGAMSMLDSMTSGLVEWADSMHLLYLMKRVFGR